SRAPAQGLVVRLPLRRPPDNKALPPAIVGRRGEPRRDRRQSKCVELDSTYFPTVRAVRLTLPTQSLQVGDNTPCRHYSSNVAKRLAAPIRKRVEAGTAIRVNPPLIKVGGKSHFSMKRRPVSVSVATC